MGFERQRRERYRVHAYECGRLNYATPVALYNYIQEAALRHWQSSVIGPATFDEKGFTWMLNQVRVRLDAYPKLNDELVVLTWPSDYKGLFAFRDFRVFDTDGAVLGEATSRWVVVDIAKRRPARVPEFIKEMFAGSDDRPLGTEFERLPELDDGETIKEFHVRSSDLDTNQHANSACYFDWLLETVPLDVLTGYLPCEVEITYKREAVLGDSMQVVSREDGAEQGVRRYHHTMRYKETDTVLALGRSAWRPVEKLG